jgi:DNA-binding NarL/FixJ family response regulator
LEKLKKSEEPENPEELEKSEEPERKKKLKVFVMDDSDISRAGLAQIFEQEKESFELFGQEKCSDKGEKLCMAVAPDVLILHTQVRDTDKLLQIADRIKEKLENTQVLFISEFDDAAYLLKIVASSCDGYVHSSISRPSLLRAAKNIDEDLYTFDRATIKKILSLKNEPAFDSKPKAPQLTPRERIIVELLKEGKDDNAIGKVLELSGGTVKNTVTNMLRRYKFKKRSQLVHELS